jgi:hypothetical protein
MTRNVQRKEIERKLTISRHKVKKREENRILEEKHSKKKQSCFLYFSDFVAVFVRKCFFQEGSAVEKGGLGEKTHFEDNHVWRAVTESYVQREDNVSLRMCTILWKLLCASFDV